MITAHSRASFVDKCRKMTMGVQESQCRLHKETSSARIKRDEEDVKKVCEVIKNCCNPFEPSAELLSISSGYVASESMRQDLLLAKEKGTTALTAFIEERLVKNSTRFFQTLPKLKLGSFHDAQKKTALAAGDRNVIIRADRNLFAHLLVIGQSHQMDLKDLLMHELGPLPWSLASSYGSLAKTNKAILSKELENGVDCLSNLPDLTTAVIIDGMALLQVLLRVPDRFSELADMVMTRILTEAGDATRIDFVADQYPAKSIKNTEKSKRGRDGELVINITNGQQLCPPQWRKFMANGSNKIGLLNFLVGEWSEKAVYAEKIKDRTLFATHGDNCTKLTSSNGTITASTVLELCSNQEEADTRMFLHGNHASQNGHQCTATRSSDTDVEVLVCYHQAAIPADMVLISGTKSRARIVSIRQVCEKLGHEMCEVLPSLQAITGCDRVSAFATKGKKKAFDLVQLYPSQRQIVGSLGERVPASDEDINKIEQFVCALYNDHSCNSVNELRYKLFCKSKISAVTPASTDKSSSSLH